MPIIRTLWLMPGLEIGLTVPSVNPQEFLKGAPFSCAASAYL